MSPRLHLVPSPTTASPPTTRVEHPAASPRLHVAFSSRNDWHAGIDRLVLPLECSAVDPQSFRCHAIGGRLHGDPVAELRLDACRLTRRDAHVAPGDAGLVQVLWLQSGRCRVRQGPRDALLDEGAWTVLDPARGSSLDVDNGTRMLILALPRHACPGCAAALPVLAGTALRGSGPAHIAMASLVALLGEPEALDAASDAALHDSVVTLIGRALANELSARGLERRRDRGAELTQVVAYIGEHLHDPRLNVATLASAFGVSRRNVYNIFAPSRTTPHACIQSARLDRARALLEEAGNAAVPVAAIARRCGFSDPAHFSRAFRARFRVAPTAWRDRRR